MAGQFLQAASDKYGGSIADESRPASRDAVAVTTAAPVVNPTLGGMVNPADPMFWFGVTAALGVGLMAYSTVSLG